MKFILGLAILFLIFSSCKINTNNSNSLGENLDFRVLAFPGAEGFGKYATGARGVPQAEIYRVTNLNDAGEGSFRDAVSKPGRFIIFTTGGIIKLKSPVTVSNNVTIAGQTAPGDGIMLYGQKVSFTGANNTIARYLKIRLGNATKVSKNTDASGISNGKNIILDHMSFSWGLDEVFSINWNKNKEGFEPDSITVQNSIIAQGLHAYNHSAGGLIQSENGHISILKSLYISNKTRNPKVKGKNEYVNNVIYNYGNKDNPKNHSLSSNGYIMGGSAMVSKANIINNYFIAGPLTLDDDGSPFSRGTKTFQLYASGNYFDDNKNGILDGQLLLEDTLNYPGITNFKSAPFPYPFSQPELSAAQAYEYMIDNVGANYPSRDAVDSLLISELSSKGKKGMYVFTELDLPFSNGGLGDYDNGSAPTDSDQDGIPDLWEEKLGLDPNNPSDALAYPTNNEGYLNIERYINGLVSQ